nr:hypothetical protein GCM10020093_016790 [Planobispora longispora]
MLREAWRLGQMTAEDYQRAADLPTLDHTRLPTGQHVPAEVVGAALAACDGDDSPPGSATPRCSRFSTPPAAAAPRSPG